MCDNHQTTERHFWKCSDCLSVCATENTPGNQARSLICGACSANMEYMGRVQKDRLVTKGTECACDYRCTSALGPNCDCKCGGANHGTGAVVHVTYDHGKAPTANIVASAQTLANLKEFKAAREAVHTELRTLEAQGFLPTPLWNHKRNLQQALRHASTLTSHSGRMKALRAVTTGTPLVSDFVGEKEQRNADLAAEKAEARAAAADAPTGRVEFSGSPISAKWIAGQYGSTLKIVLVTMDGWKVWGTAPAAIANELFTAEVFTNTNTYEGLRRNKDVACKITMTATVSPSNDDSKFAFYSRPTKATIETAELAEV